MGKGDHLPCWPPTKKLAGVTPETNLRNSWQADDEAFRQMSAEVQSRCVSGPIKRNLLERMSVFHVVCSKLLNS